MLSKNRNLEWGGKAEDGILPDCNPHADEDKCTFPT